MAIKKYFWGKELRIYRFTKKIRYIIKKYNQSNEWHFRKNVKRKHPPIIIGEDDENFLNLDITHSKTRGHHKNILFDKNPNPLDNKDSYIRDDIFIDDKKYLQYILREYELSKSDIDKIYKIINKKR